MTTKTEIDGLFAIAGAIIRLARAVEEHNTNTELGLNSNGATYSPPAPEPAPTSPKKLLNRVEAAAYIREKYGQPCRPATLAKYACIAGSNGPLFHKLGKRVVLYARDDLDDWARSRLK